MSRIGKLLASRRWLVLPPVIIGILGLLAFANSRHELQRIDDVDEVALPLRVTRAESAVARPSAKGFGTAVPARVWSAMVEVPGKVVEIHRGLRSGNRVEAGQQLVVIDPLDYELRVQQREADLANARAHVDELLATQEADQASLEIETKLLRVTEKELERLDQLRRVSSASQSEVDRARSDIFRQTQAVQKVRNSLAIVPARIDSAAANVKLAEAMLSEARRDLERTRIFAPYSGILSGVQVEVGQVVNQGASLFELHDTDTIEIKAQLSPSQLLPIIVGKQIDATSASSSRLLSAIESGVLKANVIARSGDVTIAWPGYPVRVAEAIDLQTRTIGIVIQVDNTTSTAVLVVRENRKGDESPGQLPIMNKRPPGTGVRLRPGVYCEVELFVDTSRQSVVVPITAVDDGFVFIVQDDRLRRRQVSVAYVSGKHAVITDGLAVGDLVATKPPMPMIEGMLVEPQIVDAAGGGVVASRSPQESR